MVSSQRMGLLIHVHGLGQASWGELHRDMSIARVSSNQFKGPRRFSTRGVFRFVGPILGSGGVVFHVHMGLPLTYFGRRGFVHKGRVFHTILVGGRLQHLLGLLRRRGRLFGLFVMLIHSRGSFFFQGVDTSLGSGPRRLAPLHFWFGRFSGLLWVGSTRTIVVYTRIAQVLI